MLQLGPGYILKLSSTIAKWAKPFSFSDLTAISKSSIIASSGSSSDNDVEYYITIVVFLQRTILEFEH